MQWNDARIGAGRRLGQSRTQQPHIGQCLATAGGTCQRRTDHRGEIGLRSVGNRCRRSSFERNIGRAELDSWRQVSGGDDDVDPLVIRVGAKCRDGGQDDERTGRDASGDHGAGPVRPQAVDDSTQRRRIERFPHTVKLGGK